MEAVLNSKVGVVITGFITKLQLQAKKTERISENEISQKGKFRNTVAVTCSPELYQNKYYQAKLNFIKEI